VNDRTQPGAPAWPAEPTVPDAKPDPRLDTRAETREEPGSATQTDTRTHPGAASAGGERGLAAEIAADLAEAATQLADVVVPGSRTAATAAALRPKLTERDLATLERTAVAVQARAYAPYSRFQVGAAVWGDGQSFLGVNVENASFGLTICAERNAVAAAVTTGVTRLSAVAVCTSASPPSSPCGSCRQVLAELADDPRTFRVIAINPDGERREWTLDQLLPDSFSSAELPGRRA
jgi:cytidine deaminase